MKPALIIGSTCVDVIINIPHLPKTEENIRPTSQTMSLGGCAYNVSHMLRLLGAPHTFVTPVGGGLFGDYVAKELTASGVPIAVRLPEKENGCCYCLVEETGERTFLSCHGTEYTFRKEWMEPYPAENYGLVYICGLEVEETGGDDLVRYLEEHPLLPVFYAPGPRVMKIDPKRNRRILALHPILHVNEQEAMALGGAAGLREAALRLHAITGNTVIVTLGERGSCYIEKDGTFCLVPPVFVSSVVDTIGAGDCHAGSVIACLTLGFSLYEAVSYANRAAAAATGVRGACLPPELLPKLPPHDRQSFS